MRHLSVVSEAVAPYSAGGALAPVLDEMDRVVAELATVDLEAADEPSIRDGIARMQRHTRQLQARITDAAAQLTKRQARRLDPADPDGRRTRQQAERDIQNELADTLNITHSEAKDAVQAGGALDGLSSETRRAFSQGQITNRHARKMAETIDGLLGIIDPNRLESELLQVARRQNVTDFGRHCRDLVARHCAEQAQRDLDRLHRRRYGNLAQDPDGIAHGLRHAESTDHGNPRSVVA